jgi:hypothetical protein
MSFNLCILDLKKGTKKLKYRGISYQANFTSMVTAKRKLQEQAERQSDQLGDSSIICLRPNIQLIYRGLPYYLNRQLERKGKYFFES